MKSKVINLFDTPRPAQNTGANYSKLLEQFMEAFVEDFVELECLEEIIDVAVSAWNIANMKVLTPDGEASQLFDSFRGEGMKYDVLHKMVDYKIEHFKDYTNFIRDYKVDNSSEEPVLSVITEEEELFLNNALNNRIDREDEDFAANYIDRSAVILKPLQPFYDWLNQLYPEEEFDDQMQESKIYLVDLDEHKELEAWLRKNFDKLFMMQLSGWHIDKKEWPQKRNYKMFKQWFQVEISIMIYDFEEYPISKF